MAFNWKTEVKKSLLQHKIRYRIYSKIGLVNTDVGRRLKSRIEIMEKKAHG